MSQALDLTLSSSNLTLGSIIIRSLQIMKQRHRTFSDWSLVAGLGFCWLSLTLKENRCKQGDGAGPCLLTLSQEPSYLYCLGRHLHSVHMGIIGHISLVSLDPQLHQDLKAILTQPGRREAAQELGGRAGSARPLNWAASTGALALYLE